MCCMYFGYTWCYWGIYQVHTELRGRDRRQLHSAESSEMPQRPTAWSLGRIAQCSQKSLSLSPLVKKTEFLVRLKIAEVLLFLGLNTNTRRPQVSHLLPHRSFLQVPRPPTRCGPGAVMTRWSSTG